MHDPKVLFLDEPTAGVDVELRYSLWGYIRELNHAGLTILLTTHYLEEAEALCEEIALINGGRIAAQGTNAELKERYGRSEEHTSELQSRQYLVCRLLLEKKKKDIVR